MFEYAIQNKENYPENSEHGVFLVLLHPKFGEMEKVLIRNVDFREEPKSEETEDFRSLNDILENDYSV